MSLGKLLRLTIKNKSAPIGVQKKSLLQLSKHLASTKEIETQEICSFKELSISSNQHRVLKWWRPAI